MWQTAARLQTLSFVNPMLKARPFLQSLLLPRAGERLEAALAASSREAGTARWDAAAPDPCCVAHPARVRRWPDPASLCLRPVIAGAGFLRELRFATSPPHPRQHTRDSYTRGCPRWGGRGTGVLQVLLGSSAVRELLLPSWELGLGV